MPTGPTTATDAPAQPLDPDDRSLGRTRRVHRLVRPFLAGWPFVAAVWLASRALFLAAGAIGAHVARQADPAGFPLEPPGVLNHWANWDGAWYSAIAADGYRATVWPSSASYFPVFPALLRVGMLVGVGPAAAGVAISLVASLLALFFLYDLARDSWGERVARAATLAFAFFPTAFFLNAAYAESVFLAAAIGAVWLARVRGELVLGSLLACVAAGTRNAGVFLVIPLVHEWLRRRPELGIRALAAVALVPCGLAAYMFWLWRWADRPLLFATAQAGWGRTLASPAATVERAWEAARPAWTWAVHPGRVLAAQSGNPAFGAMEAYNLVFLALLVVLLVGTVVRVRGGLAAYALLAGLLPLATPPAFSPLASLPRYVLAAFPVFFVLGIVLARSRVVLVAWLIGSAAFGVLLTVYFTSWRWVA